MYHLGYWNEILREKDLQNSRHLKKTKLRENEANLYESLTWERKRVNFSYACFKELKLSGFISKGRVNQISLLIWTETFFFPFSEKFGIPLLSCYETGTHLSDGLVEVLLAFPKESRLSHCISSQPRIYPLMKTFLVVLQLSSNSKVQKRSYENKKQIPIYYRHKKLEAVWS